jgi:large subunit ribosomal protein L6
MINTEFKYNLEKLEKALLIKVNKSYILFIKKNNKEFFVKIPLNIEIVSKDNNIIFCIKNDKYLSKFNVFKNCFLNIINTKNPYKKILELNGLGFKINTIKKDSQFEITFKLGYSHQIVLNAPNSISKVSFEKKKLFLESHDKINLGNFSQHVYRLKAENAYKDRGFSFFKNKKTLKPIKKK